jgi:hypothetical protein
MTKNLSQAHQIILIIVQNLMGHGVLQQVRMQRQAANLSLFVATISNASISQRPTFANEDTEWGNRWSRFKPWLKSTAGQEGHRNGRLLVPLGIPEDDWAGSFRQNEVVTIETDQIAEPTQEQVEDSG